MKRATAVIGAAWGDEGKGLLTHYFSRSGGVVIRYNGGAQAGHTVCLPGGRRHVFHHFGSGTFRGADTFLSRHFVVNPMLWVKEKEELQKLLPEFPVSMVDDRALVSTPWDMLLNQEAERVRGDRCHGSCGVGINETAHRASTQFVTRVGDLFDPSWPTICDWIRDEYVPLRAAELGIDVCNSTFAARWNDSGILDHFLSSSELFRKNVLTTQGLRQEEPVVFEGAQGLLLGEDSEFFPHVTRGFPGLKNVVEFAINGGIEQIDAVYVMRAYMTRHGAGPFPSEDKSLHYFDNTNTPNDWQGKLRFGGLDIPLLKRTIWRDITAAMGRGVQITPYLAVTHLDQVNDPRLLVDVLGDALDLPVRYRAFGPCQDDVQEAVGKLPVTH